MSMTYHLIVDGLWMISGKDQRGGFSGFQIGVSLENGHYIEGVKYISRLFAEQKSEDLCKLMLFRLFLANKFDKFN